MTDQVKFVKVKSTSQKGVFYTIRVFPSGEIKCDCPAFVFRNKCKHVKSYTNKLKNTA